MFFVEILLENAAVALKLIKFWTKFKIFEKNLIIFVIIILQSGLDILGQLLVGCDLLGEVDGERRGPDLFFEK